MITSIGIGLAAPQVGINKRLIIVDIGEGMIALANPEIVESKGNDVLSEGCLSIPEIYVEVDGVDISDIKKIVCGGKYPTVLLKNGL